MRNGTLNEAKYVLMKVKKGDKGEEMIPKAKEQFTEEEWPGIRKHRKALNIIVHVIDPNEFNKVSICETIKEIWDILVAIHEGSNQVKETKISIYVHQYATK